MSHYGAPRHVDLEDAGNIPIGAGYDSAPTIFDPALPSPTSAFGGFGWRTAHEPVHEEAHNSSSLYTNPVMAPYSTAEADVQPFAGAYFALDDEQASPHDTAPTQQVSWASAAPVVSVKIPPASTAGSAATLDAANTEDGDVADVQVTVRFKQTGPQTSTAQLDCQPVFVWHDGSLVLSGIRHSLRTSTLQPEIGLMSAPQSSVLSVEAYRELGEIIRDETIKAMRTSWGTRAEMRGDGTAFFQLDQKSQKECISKACLGAVSEIAQAYADKRKMGGSALPQLSVLTVRRPL
jgi:hypothetical protein